jgi:GMP synthase (glutamine-hydrolysing)
MKTAVAIRHVAFEDLGTFAPVLERTGYEIRYVEAGVDDLTSPTVATADLLIVLGGPIGAYDDDAYPFLADELRVLERRFGAARPTLGVCLGAQLIARATGKRVYAAEAKEIGYGPIIPTAEGRQSCLAHLGDADWQVLHWHGDTFDLPEGARPLASTSVTENQAFAVGSHVLGLQFHMEVDPSKIERWLIGHACELSTTGVDIARLRSDARRVGVMVARSGQASLETWLMSMRPARPHTT